MNSLFPLKEYRGYTHTDNNVRARIASAKAQTIDTQFDAAMADSLAASILAATDNAGMSYTFTVDGIVSPSDMAGAMKFISVTYGNSITMYLSRITALKVDWAKNQTTITVRGVN